jgi:riboflavin biosynthesis pyrimidine reductase
MLWPAPGAVEVDPAEVYGADPRPAPLERPWVVLNMIASADGSATDPFGRSGGLGGPADRQVFSALRAVADVVLAGASTVRTERYGPPRTPPALRQGRRARGQTAHPRLAVVTASLAIDPDLPLFRDAADGLPPIVITTAAALARAHAEGRLLPTIAEVVIAGDEALEWDTALASLRTGFEARVVLAEGGPTINGQLVTAGLVDELCLTLAPQLVSGDGPRVVRGTSPRTPLGLALDRVLLDEGYLFLRYLRAAG